MLCAITPSQTPAISSGVRVVNGATSTLFALAQIKSNILQGVVKASIKKNA
jgi:hypothetical protein